MKVALTREREKRFTAFVLAHQTSVLRHACAWTSATALLLHGKKMLVTTELMIMAKHDDF